MSKKINKFILEVISTNEQEPNKTMEYKTLRQIAEKIEIDYHQCRSIYMQSKTPTKLHPHLAEIYRKIKIYDNPANKTMLNLDF